MLVDLECTPYVQVFGMDMWEVEESMGGMGGAHKRPECMVSNKKQRIAMEPNPIPLDPLP